MIKVGITGQNGFIGRHLCNFLGTKESIEIIPFERNFFENNAALQEFVKKCDVVVHIAAMNRHKDPQVIYDTNVSLVAKLINACKETTSTPKIIFSSSSQESNDNEYGRSKKEGRRLLEEWANSTGASVASLIIPNVFGPFGKPFYNSVVATFCHQVVVGEQPTIHNDGSVNLIYVNELVAVFYNTILSTSQKQIELLDVAHTATKKVSEILGLLNKFQETYVSNGVVPNLSNSFEKNLFNTFRCFIPSDYFPRKFIQHTDNRGSFVEVMRANTSGQSSYSTTVPGITRGNHYHTRKVERFAVISGKARIQLRKIDTNEVIDYYLSGDEPSYVDMPIWYTHNITNIGETELVTLFWIDEPYNQDDADTYFVEV